MDERGMPDDNIDISDVIEVIETDPDYPQKKPSNTAKMLNGTNAGGQWQQQQQQQQQSPSQPSTSKPRCVIVEQPAPKQLRFRYACEGRSAGSIPGVNSTPDAKTYPTIAVEGYRGMAVVVVSCVTKDDPYKPHPHKLVGREGCKKGVCTVNIPEETMTVSFQNLGIQCVKRKDIEEALKTREEIRVDPFRTGFSHRSSPTSIDLNAVRLCFQVFLSRDGSGRYTEILDPVVSNPIYDKKAMSDLVIVRLSDCVCPVDGGNKDIILLCEKVAKEDIQIRFYEEQNGKLAWEGYGDFQPSQVHKQTAIWFRPPKYKTFEVIEPVKMFVQLKRPSDGATSEPVPFQMVSLGGKRRATDGADGNQNKKKVRELYDSLKNTPPVPMNYFQEYYHPPIKDEPKDVSRSPFQCLDNVSQSPQHYQQSYNIIPQPIPSASAAPPPSLNILPPLQQFDYATNVYVPQISVLPENTTTLHDMDVDRVVQANDLSLNNVSLPDFQNIAVADMSNSLDKLVISIFDEQQS